MNTRPLVATLAMLIAMTAQAQVTVTVPQGVPASNCKRLLVDDAGNTYPPGEGPCVEWSKAMVQVSYEDGYLDYIVAWVKKCPTLDYNKAFEAQLGRLALGKRPSDEERNEIQAVIGACRQIVSQVKKWASPARRQKSPSRRAFCFV